MRQELPQQLHHCLSCESNENLVNNVFIRPAKFNFKFLSPDENECATDNNSCEQLCRDTEGSYYCECHKGYQVSADRNSCQGKRKIILLSCTFYEVTSI